MAILRSYSATFERNDFVDAALARYRFNEGSGADIAVDSIDGFDGEYQTGAAPGVAGFIGDGAATFDGDGGFVLVNNTLTGTITVSAFGDSLVNGLDIGQALPRPLSTVRSNRFQIGRTAAEAILSATARSAEMRVIDTGYTIIEGDTA